MKRTRLNKTRLKRTRRWRRFLGGREMGELRPVEMGFDEMKCPKMSGRGRGWEELGEFRPVAAELSSARDAAAALLVREGS